MTANRNPENPPRQSPGAKRPIRALDAALGMGAELLFACGLMAVGFAISLLSGW